MTDKELSYVEDATMHEIRIINICKRAEESLEEEELKEFIQGEIKKHEELRDNLKNLLEANANE